MSVRVNAEVFRRIPLFAECDPAHLQVMAFACDRQEFPSGSSVIRQGETGDSGYLILRGAADVLLTEAGVSRAIARVEPGSFIGELGMIAMLPYAVTVAATSDVSVARVSRSLFMRVVEEFPDFGVKVMAVLSRKLAGSVSELKAVQPGFDQARPFSRR